MIHANAGDAAAATTEMGVLIREDEPEGRMLAFKDAQFSPLDYGTLKGLRLHEPITVPLEMRRGVLIRTDLPGVEDGALVSVRATLQSPFSARAISLVRGGWIPAGLAMMNSEAIVLIDRNILTDIEGRFDGGTLTGLKDDFLDFFAQYPVRLNPLLCDMEGNMRRRLRRPELETELARIRSKLERALPRARIVAGDQSVVAMEGLIEDTRVSTEAYQGFLLEVAGDLAAPVGRKRRPAVWGSAVRGFLP